MKTANAIRNEEQVFFQLERNREVSDNETVMKTGGRKIQYIKHVKVDILPTGSSACFLN